MRLSIVAFKPVAERFAAEIVRFSWDASVKVISDTDFTCSGRVMAGMSIGISLETDEETGLISQVTDSMPKFTNSMLMSSPRSPAIA